MVTNLIQKVHKSKEKLGPGAATLVGIPIWPFAQAAVVTYPLDMKRFITTLLGACAVTWAANTRAQDCYAPWGQYVPNGGSVIAYSEERPRPGVRCQSEWRYCRDGYLSGFYRYPRCEEDYGCETEFGYVPHLGTVTAYLNSAEYGGRKCVSEIRQCSYGYFSGSYRNRWCTEHP